MFNIMSDDINFSRKYIEEKYGNLDNLSKTEIDKLPPLDRIMIESLQNGKARAISSDPSGAFAIEIDEDIPLPLIINI